MLRKVIDLTDEVLRGPVPTNECDLSDEWNQVVLFHLISSLNGLQAVRLVSADTLYGPAQVLTSVLV